jgi:hypothetical protein
MSNKKPTKKTNKGKKRRHSKGSIRAFGQYLKEKRNQR